MTRVTCQVRRAGLAFQSEEPQQEIRMTLRTLPKIKRYKCSCVCVTERSVVLSSPGGVGQMEGVCNSQLYIVLT